MTHKFSSPRIACLAFGLAVAAGAATFAAVQPALPLESLTVEEQAALRQALSEERRAARQAARDAERVAELESEIAYLQSRLMITAEQAPFWNAVAEALRSDQAAQLQARQARRVRRNSLVGPPSFPEQLEQDRTELVERIERLDVFIDAFRPLYAEFSAEQQFIADRLLEVDDGEIRIDDDD